MVFFFYFSLKPYVVTPHLSHLIELDQMSGHNMFYAELTTITVKILNIGTCMSEQTV